MVLKFLILKSLRTHNSVSCITVFVETKHIFDFSIITFMKHLIIERILYADEESIKALLRLSGTCQDCFKLFRGTVFSKMSWVSALKTVWEKWSSFRDQRALIQKIFSHAELFELLLKLFWLYDLIILLLLHYYCKFNTCNISILTLILILEKYNII